MFTPQTEEKHLELITDIDKHTPDEIEGDEERIMQILQNLLSNAIRYTDHGHVVIKICMAGRAVLQISVIDSGTGIISTLLTISLSCLKMMPV